MKKIPAFAIFIIALFCLILIVPSSWAGSRHHRHRHCFQGTTIGIGTYMVGKKLPYQRHCPPIEARLPYRQYQPSLRPPQYGHWEVRRVWVPPTYIRFWNPGQYNRRNCWVPGRWIKMIDQPGYWKKQRVWVAHR